ncbi:MAG: metal-dependent transcriptional regulator, partial [Butyricicoccus pullicaecorum]|nr:metal-dependent transcriptional regulator [Butyricicoccus pullicaecorum]
MALIRESGENYLELILDISREQGSVRSVDIARRLGVSRASVSKA